MQVPLLPKLRGDFAEFLRESYLAPLSILYFPTCVGFGYRQCNFNVFRAFLGSEIATTDSLVSRTRAFPRRVFASLQRLERLHKVFHHLAGFNLLRPPALNYFGTGLFTRCPSTTLFSLALGPD